MDTDTFYINRNLSIDIEKAMKIVSRNVILADVFIWAKYLKYDTDDPDVELDYEYAKKTNLKKPILIGTVRSEKMPLDGHHRLWRAYTEGVKTLPSFVLTEQQTVSCEIITPTKESQKWELIKSELVQVSKPGVLIVQDSLSRPVILV